MSGAPRLDRHVAVVTGASQGIGRAIADALLVEGVSVCVVGRDEAALRRAFPPEGCPQQGDAHPLAADLLEDDGIDAVVSFMSREFGRLDLLVHSAAALRLGRVDETTDDDIEVQYRLNLRAPHRLTRGLLALLRASRGQVVFVNSSVGAAPGRAGLGAYAASKQALRAIADALRAEVNDDGIRVLSVYPGRTATPLQAGIHAAEGRPYRPEQLLQPEDVATIVVAALTLPRTAEVTDIHLRPMADPS